MRSARVARTPKGSCDGSRKARAVAIDRRAREQPSRDGLPRPAHAREATRACAGPASVANRRMIRRFVNLSRIATVSNRSGLGWNAGSARPAAGRLSAPLTPLTRGSIQSDVPQERPRMTDGLRTWDATSSARRPASSARRDRVGPWGRADPYATAPAVDVGPRRAGRALGRRRSASPNFVAEDQALAEATDVDAGEPANDLGFVRSCGLIGKIRKR
jgi:hypothetical protein